MWCPLSLIMRESSRGTDGHTGGLGEGTQTGPAPGKKSSSPHPYHLPPASIGAKRPPGPQHSVSKIGHCTGISNMASFHPCPVALAKSCFWDFIDLSRFRVAVLVPRGGRLESGEVLKQRGVDWDSGLAENV